MATFEKKALLSSEARAGLLIVISIVVVILGLAFLQEYSFKKAEYDIIALFETVIGLDKDDPVIVSGLKVGKVGAMHLGEEKVEVVLKINSQYRFPQDSKAILKNLTLLGEKAIEIERGHSSEFLSEGAVIEGTLETDIFELTEAAAPIGEDLAVLLKRFRSTFNDEAQSNIQGSLKNIEAISSEVSQNIGRNVVDLQQAIENMSATAQNLKSLTNPKGKNINQILANLEESSANLKKATEQIRNSSTSLERILSKLEKGEGALGQLLSDETIYDNLVRASARLDSLILDVRNHPRKYLRIELF